MQTSSTLRLKIHTLALISLLLGTLAYTGCRTMEGAGKDIERAGEKIQDNAKDARR
jgi:predicted small secreted protein